MEDMYVKPGNQERGWNDPPQFSYGFQKAHGTHRNLLNKRAPTTDTGAPPTSPPRADPLAPPPASVAPPPPGHSPCWLAMSPGAPRENSDNQVESKHDLMGFSVFEGALAACRQTVAPQVCNDMAKRLHLLQDSWISGRLSVPVRRRMTNLIQEFQMCHWDAADDLHRSLMVDHVSEVSQWMVGVKRLIAETRKLSPELIETLKKSEEPIQDSPKCVEDPSEVIEDSSVHILGPNSQNKE